MTGQPANPQRTAGIIPQLHTLQQPPSAFDGSTCFEAGHLVSRNAGWRSTRPVVDAAKCTGCLKCYLYCPDGAIFKTHAANVAHGPQAAVAVDLDFCKGCGICARICGFDAIAMIPERQV